MNKTLLHVGLGALVLACLACSGTELGSTAHLSKQAESEEAVSLDETEIVKGAPSRGKDPAVVALRVGNGLCTGALIAKDLVLTARHCVAETANSVECPAQGKQVYRDHAPESIDVLLGDRVEGQSASAHGLEIIAPSGVTLCDADIAVLVLDRPLANVRPLGVSTGGFSKGDLVRSVGFGRLGDEGPAGLKMVRENVAILSVSPAEFTVGEATCQGDSGGPAMDEATGDIVGVVSRGGPSCEGKGVHNVYTRVDAYSWLIDFALSRSGASEQKSDAGPKGAPRASGDKPSSDVGNACEQAGSCATGLCLRSDQGGYCTRRCGEGARCPARFNCKKVESENVCVKVR
jgi:hypothetical protein